MVKFVGLVCLVLMSIAFAVLSEGSGFLGVGLLATLVGSFAILVTVFNELQRSFRS